MNIKRIMIFKYQLVLFAINKLLVNGEWVEMPQFSDDSKVYKLSVDNDYDDDTSFYNKFVNNNQKTVTNHDIKTVDKLMNEYGNTDKNNSGEILFTNHDDYNVAENLDSKVNMPIYTEASTSAVPSTLELPTEEDSVSSTAIPVLLRKKSQSHSSEREECSNETLKGIVFQDYLPMEMLRKVHRTLKSQPTTLDGKIRFLKQFEKNLMTEIEARLSKALNPPRQKRGTHDYYDHDDEIGFPSLEGALMAISFLTFAVYLVRLVMLLFRNASNSANSATILFGRNRRSIDTINEQTQEILNYLDNFETN